MNISEFKESLLTDSPPLQVSEYIKAMWYDAKDNWKKAHDLIQNISDKNASRIHAYLHRKEGDIWNADYWYAKAGKKRPSVSLSEEWEQIVNDLL